jgi:hypothetical protein
VKEFKSATFATQVYKYADKMQISSLTKELVIYFEEEINKASQVFVIFDLYVNSNNQQGRDICKEESLLKIHCKIFNNLKNCSVCDRFCQWRHQNLLVPKQCRHSCE